MFYAVIAINRKDEEIHLLVTSAQDACNNFNFALLYKSNHAALH